MVCTPSGRRKTLLYATFYLRFQFLLTSYIKMIFTLELFHLKCYLRGSLCIPLRYQPPWSPSLSQPENGNNNLLTTPAGFWWTYFIFLDVAIHTEVLMTTYNKSYLYGKRLSSYIKWLTANNRTILKVYFLCKSCTPLWNLNEEPKLINGENI